ncbi:MAG: 50S ribosomal protein L18e [Thermoproteus sp.]|nr:50S ribosomal protein L18e [Thermoproteus sp.]
MPPNPTGPTNIKLKMLARFLRKAARANEAPLWSYIAELLERPARGRAEVNLSRVNMIADDGDVIVIPGKLLGSGKLNKKIVVAVAGASKSAVEAVLKSGGEVISIAELVRRNPKGSGVKIVV